MAAKFRSAFNRPMKASNKRPLSILVRLLAVLYGLSLSGFAKDASPPSQPSVNVTVDVSHPGVTIPAEALGLSYETSILMPNAQGMRYFRPHNAALLEVFRTLGVKS